MCGFDRYTSGRGGAERANWLEIWDGAPLDVSRKSGDRRLVYVPRPFVSVIGGIQPHRFEEAVAHDDDGLAPRLLLYYPDAAVVDAPNAYIDAEVEGNYRQAHRRAEHHAAQRHAAASVAGGPQARPSVRPRLSYSLAGKTVRRDWRRR